MKQVAIYARYSTKLQNELSVEDQIAYCKRHIEKQENMTHTHTFFDKETSGKNIANRQGLCHLLEYLKEGAFDIVLVESLDRLTRNAGDSHKLFETIEYYGAELYTVNEGKANNLLVGFKGTMNALYISDTADKVRRSQTERARQGFFPAGVAYGYRVKTNAVDEKGKRLYGVREIISEKASVVRRIFDLYIEGWGSKKIAAFLNAEAIPSPSGGFWTSGAILGTKSREVGVLSNQLYIGKLVYNKTQRKKHPHTGKLNFFPRPESEWIISEIPELRIVPDGIWEQALARRTKNKVTGLRQTKEKRILSSSSKPMTGLVYCGVCGHKALLANHQRYVCGHYRLHRKCNNARAVRTPILLEKMFFAIKTHIKTTDWSHAFDAHLSPTIHSSLSYLEEQKASIEKNISSLVRALEQGIDVDKVRDRIRELEEKRIKTNLKIAHHYEKEDAWTSLIGIKNDQICSGLLASMEIFEGVKNTGDKDGYKWRATMSLLVEKVVTTPIPDTKRGMTIDVKIAPMEGWAEFYRRITASRAHH